MKRISLAMLILILAAALAAPALATTAASGISADEALRLLKEGNSRYVDGKPQHPRQDRARRALTAAQGQHPLAAVLTCSDSRVPAEIIFDQGIGDLFVVRVAGNVAATDEIGSIEYAVDHLATPLVVVLGHTQCGAVDRGGGRHQAAPQHRQPGGAHQTCGEQSPGGQPRGRQGRASQGRHHGQRLAGHGRYVATEPDHPGEGQGRARLKWWGPSMISIPARSSGWGRTPTRKNWWGQKGGG